MDIYSLREALKADGAPRPEVRAVVAWLDEEVEDGTRPRPVRLRALLDVFGDPSIYRAVFEHPRYAELNRALLDGDREAAADLFHGLEVAGVAPGEKMAAVLAELEATEAVTRRRGEVLGLLAPGEPVPDGVVERALIPDAES